MRVGTSEQPNGIIRFGDPGGKEYPQFIQSEINQLKLERGNGETLVKYNTGQHEDGPKVVIYGDISASGLSHTLGGDVTIGDDLSIGGGRHGFDSHGSNTLTILSGSSHTLMQFAPDGATTITGNITASGNISASLNDASHVLGGQLSLMGTANGSIHLYSFGNLRTSLNAKGNINSYINAGVETNLGIGTITPTAKLHVVGSTLISGSLTVTGNATQREELSIAVIANSQNPPEYTHFSKGDNK
jgi:hypothetical protein